MTKKLLPLALLLGSCTPVADTWFSGRIVYHVTIKTIDGQDLTEQLRPAIGVEDPYYISGGNYKMYTEQKRLVQLYTGSNNQLKIFIRGQATTVAGDSGESGATVTPLTETTTIAGYTCKSLRIDNVKAGTSTRYFYSPKLRVDPTAFSKHSIDNFNLYLQKTDGALSLRIVTTDTTKNYVMTQEATSVTPMTLTAADFTPNAPAR